jgi:synaptic vesicle membrane protein VAT-1
MAWNMPIDALGQCGRLVVYGFHSNLPRGEDLLSPFKWLEMGVGMFKMPSFDAMNMTMENKAVLGFNLSFFADEHEIFRAYLGQVNEWVIAEKLKLSEVSKFEMSEVAEAHKLIQSGSSVGKIVLTTGATLSTAH